jgi:hypothetical protein
MNDVDKECRSLSEIPTYNIPSMYILKDIDVSFEHNVERYNSITKTKFYEWELMVMKFDSNNTIALTRYIGSENFIKILNMKKDLSINNGYRYRLFHNNYMTNSERDIFIKEVPLIYNYGSYNKYRINVDIRNIIVTYNVWEVREEIIAFLKHKGCDDNILLNDLMVAFTKGNCNTLKEYIIKKAKYLNELDMDDYVRQLNEETENKVRRIK